MKFGRKTAAVVPERAEDRIGASPAGSGQVSGRQLGTDSSRLRPARLFFDGEPSSGARATPEGGSR